MSLDTIIMNSKNFDVSGFEGTRIIRTNFAPVTFTKADTLEISHSFGTGNKPDRHLISRSIMAQDLGGSGIDPYLEYRYYSVFVIPKGAIPANVTAFYTGAANKLVDDITDYISASNYAIIPSLVAGGLG